jgi:hypothetical protein
MVRARAAKALASDFRFRVFMVFSSLFGFVAPRPLRFALRVGVIYNYNTNSEASPNPKNIRGAFYL